MLGRIEEGDRRMSEIENTIRVVILGIPRTREKELIELLGEDIKKELFRLSNIHICYEKTVEE
jgi:hypothetical protein